MNHIVRGTTPVMVIGLGSRGLTKSCVQSGLLYFVGLYLRLPYLGKLPRMDYKLWDFKPNGGSGKLEITRKVGLDRVKG